MKRSKSRSNATAADAPPPVEVHVHADGRELTLGEAFARVRVRAGLMPEAQVQVCRADLPVVFANARAGTAAVMAHAAEITAQLPATDLGELREIPDIAAALLQASAMVTTGTEINGDVIAAKYAELQTHRQPMMLVAQAFAMKGIFPADRVADIVRGAGMHNHALDAIQLAQLFTSTPGAVGKHPFTASDFAEASAHGHWILRNVTPDGARRPKEVDESAKMRDRIWSLLCERHEKLRRVAVFLFGEKVVDEKVPALQSRVVVSARSKPSVAPPVPPS